MPFPIFSSIKPYFRFFVNNGFEDIPPMEEAPLKQVLIRVASSLLGLGATFALSYFSVKYLLDKLDPTSKEKQKSKLQAELLLKKLKLPVVDLTEYELCIAANLVDTDTLTVDWEDIGGLQDVAEEITNSVILPFKRADLYSQSSLLSAPKGVLLYGPPGCGKTMIAKATAKAANSRFINLQVSSLVDKWYGESQKRAEAVFTLAMKIQPTIIFIDEIDSFLRSRNTNDHEATAMVKTQFMLFWDGLLTDQDCQVMIMGATNRPTDVDAAIRRRMPCMFKIGLPDVAARENILSIILKDEEVTEKEALIKDLASKTNQFSGSDLKELCRNAAVVRVREYLHRPDFHGTLRPVSRVDFDTSLAKNMRTRMRAFDFQNELAVD